MDAWKRMAVVGFWLVASALTASAQLEKVVAEASGIET